MFLSPTDVVKQTFRESQQNAPQYTALTSYIFQWHLLAKALSQKSFSLKKLFLRTYLKVVDQRHTDNAKIMLTSTIKIYNGSKAQSSSHTHNNGTSIAQQSQEVILELCDQWIEINLTEAAKTLWPQIASTTEVEVTVKAVVDCVDRIRVPFSFVNPAEIPLEYTETRDSSISNQPLLLVFANDEEMKLSDRDSSNMNPHTTSTTDHSRRSISDICQRHDFVINFNDLDLRNITPLQLNIGKCSGSCSETNLRQRSSLGTNHAKIMSNIQSRVPNTVTMDGPATSPCCVPTLYYPQTYLLMLEESGTFTIRPHFKDLEVISCSCQ